MASTERDLALAGQVYARGFDVPTIAAIGMLAYQASNLAHEGLGHGGACLLVGGRPLALSSAWFDGDTAGVSEWGVRAIKAGGTLVNVAVGLALYLAVRAARRTSGPTYYFLWLSMMVNLLQGGGYLMTSPFMGFGDWKAFVAGLPNALVWKVGLTAAGLAISFAALLAGRRTVEPLLGRDPVDRRRRLWRLCLLPYLLIGGVVFSVAASFNPGGKIFVLTSALAHLGGTAWLVWLPAWVKAPAASTPELPLDLSRRWGWITAGAITLLLCVFVLGPSIRFAPAAP